MPDCPATYEAVWEQEELGSGGCPVCGRPANAHPTEDPNEGLAEEFDYGIGGARFSNQTPSQGAHGNG
jgi:hypothetical protein